MIGGWLEGEGGRAGGSARCCSASTTTDGRLRYAGRVGLGLSASAELDDLAARLAALARDDSPFVAGPAGRPPKGAHWVEPVLLGEVAFTERSSDGLLRQPVWLGPARRRRRAARRCATSARRAARAGPPTALVDGREIAVTNLDKVLYPGRDAPSAEVIEYAAAIAPVLRAAPRRAAR